MSDLNTLMESDKENEKFVTIERITLRGLSLKLKDKFNLRDEPIFISANDRWNVINNLRKLKDAKVNFPFMTFKLTGMEVNAQGYNPKMLRKFGVYGAPNDSKNGMAKTEPIPINMTVEIGYITDSIYSLLNFSNRWMYASVDKLLDMEIEFDGTNYGIQVEPDSNLTVPEKDMTIEQVNAYEFVGNMVIHTYTSQAMPIENFPQFYPVTNLAIIPRLVNGDDITGEEITAIGQQKLNANPDYGKVPVIRNTPHQGTQVGYEQMNFVFDDNGIKAVPNGYDQ